MSDPLQMAVSPQYQRRMAEDAREKEKRLRELRLQAEAMTEGAMAGDTGMYPEVDRAQDELIHEQMRQKGLVPDPNVPPPNPQNIPAPKAPPARYNVRQEDVIRRLRARGPRPPVV